VLSRRFGSCHIRFFKELLTPLLLGILPKDEAAQAAMRPFIPAIAGGISFVLFAVILILIYESGILE